ncbi:MAG: radical SAM protein [Oscillospiraceae bacterium]|jgi:hypothetical protein|nr:radical SAM protein [Oscillospiraceae bacterium]
MNRYAEIAGRFPREMVLLRGTGCFHRQCLFCDYDRDAAADPFPDNRRVLARVTGACGVLDVINSGSIHELDGRTLALLGRVLAGKHIHTLWTEAHYAYAPRLQEIRDRFPGVTVRFRTGLESFDPAFRRRMRKGIPDDVTPEAVRAHFDGVCLLVGVEGQTRAGIARDIARAARLFDHVSVNVFCPNSTPVRRDEALTDWFLTRLAPHVRALPNCEVLAHNTDLGVG